MAIQELETVCKQCFGIADARNELDTYIKKLETKDSDTILRRSGKYPWTHKED